MTTAKKKDVSPGYRLVDQVWSHLKAKSWIRINHAMQKAIDLAVESCMDFVEADIAEINEKMRGGYWLHMEALYTTAVGADNVSACRAIEHAMERRPWILHGRRLAVGAEIEHGFITSITDDKLIACVYEHGRRSGKPVKRHNVTRDMIAAENSKRRAVAKQTIKCPKCKHEQPDRRSGSAWQTTGEKFRRPTDRCTEWNCQADLPAVKS